MDRIRFRDKANSAGAQEALALVKAKREQEAQELHDGRVRAVREVAMRQLVMKPADSQRLHPISVGASEEFHIPYSSQDQESRAA